MEKLKTDDIVKMIHIMTDVIIANEIPFCELDSAAGDGDFGMSLAKGFRVVKEEWDEVSKYNIGDFLKDVGMIITEYCGGASGPIWGSAFRGAAKSVLDKDEIDLSEFAQMMDSAAISIMKCGGAKLGDKTLLDALIPAVDALKESADDSDSIESALMRGAKAAVEGGESTKKIVAKKGRASYVGDRSLDYPDAGATALGIIFTEIAREFAPNA